MSARSPSAQDNYINIFKAMTRNGGKEVFLIMILQEWTMAGLKGDDDAYTDEETERRAREAILRSFQTPYKPQREMVGKARRSTSANRAASKTAKKAK